MLYGMLVSIFHVLDILDSLSTKTLPPKRTATKAWTPLTGSFGSPVSFHPVHRVPRYLGSFLFVIDATICVSEGLSEMTNVAISAARKLYVSMYHDPRYTYASLFRFPVQ